MNDVPFCLLYGDLLSTFMRDGKEELALGCKGEMEALWETGKCKQSNEHRMLE